MGMKEKSIPPAITLIKSISGVTAVPSIIISQKNALIESKITPDQNHSLPIRPLGLFNPFFPHLGQSSALSGDTLYHLKLH